MDAGLGFGVANEGDKIRLTVPPLTEENRKELVKKLNEKMEKTRINLRRRAISVKTPWKKRLATKRSAKTTNSVSSKSWTNFPQEKRGIKRDSESGRKRISSGDLNFK